MLLFCCRAVLMRGDVCRKENVVQRLSRAASKSAAQRKQLEERVQAETTRELTFAPQVSRVGCGVAVIVMYPFVTSTYALSPSVRLLFSPSLPLSFYPARLTKLAGAWHTALGEHGLPADHR